MAGNGVPEKEKCCGVTGEAGGSAKGLLLVLLALAVCFGYFYFFTDILRSKEETPTQPEVYTTEVKKPLPERPTEPAAITTEQTAPATTPVPAPAGEAPAVSPRQEGKELKVAGNAELNKETVSPAPTAKIVQKPGPTVTKKPVAPAQVRTATAPSKPMAAAPKEVKNVVKPAPVPEKPKDVKSAAKQAQPPARQKTVATKPAQSPARAATATARTETAKATVKDIRTSSTDRKKSAAESKGTVTPVSAKDVAAKPEKARTGDARPAPAKEVGNYTLVVGSYVMKSSMLADKAKLERAGLTSSVSAGKKKSEPMNRLLVAEFGSYSSAKSELNRVRKASKDAFLLQEKGRFTVYAGSYFRHDRALQEQDRLRKQGFVPIVKKSDAPVSTYTLTSGSFPTREAALKEAARLRKLGFNPLPSPLKKQ